MPHQCFMIMILTQFVKAFVQKNNHIMINNKTVLKIVVLDIMLKMLDAKLVVMDNKLHLLNNQKTDQ